MYEGTEKSLGIFGIPLVAVPEIIKKAADIFGGAAAVETGPAVSIGVLGIKVCSQGPVPWLIFKPAWDNAPQAAKDVLWNRLVSLGGMSGPGVVAQVGADPKTSDEVRAGLICMKANGSDDCRIDSDRNRASAAVAAEFVSRWRFAEAAPDSTAQRAEEGLSPVDRLVAGAPPVSALLIGGALLAALALGGGLKGKGQR